MKFIKTDNGHYRSECGRFRIVRDNLRGRTKPKWILTDATRQDPCSPQYNWTYNCYTLARAKAVADRIVRTCIAGAAMKQRAERDIQEING